MRYLLMIYGDEAGYEAATEEQREALRNEYGRVAAGWGSAAAGRRRARRLDLGDDGACAAARSNS